ncbi:hypothetical protein CLCR_07194 [Cladophialophora carrionii]|uniref:Zn(2)-C6 fungal-type domain-containing protein n=1 Tax=Cladophialophora carrionii TaxID=86049 RepID=A0A1C1CND8_9EURO|nr:hypothetical protein CLCR_07194 [Cladophialophora carrionii]
MAATNPPSTAHAASSGSTVSLELPLRNSCDACASAKLRCIKEKPTCHRCAKRGLTCEYVAIKRAGRKPGSRSSVNEGSTNSSTGRPRPPQRTQSLQSSSVPIPTDKLNEQLAMLNQSLPTTFVDLDTASDVSFTIDGPEFNFLNTAELLSTHVDGGASNCSCSSLSSTSASCDSNDGGGCNRHDSFSTALPSLETTVPEFLALSSPSAAGWNSAFPELDLTETSCSCLTEATSFITRLSHLSSTVCNTWAILDLDNVTILRVVLDVVEQNKVTINAVSAILNCPNYHDGCLLAIISFVIFKMLSLYAAIACKDPNLQDLRQPGLTRSTPQSETALPSPAGLVDNYSMERSDPQHMARRIVLGELHRLRHLIAQLVEKLKSQSVTQESGEGAKTQESMDLDCEMRAPLSSVMYEQLDLDLRRRLKALSWAIVDRMTRL